MERTLRGHHLLCVHGFQGMGYSPAFIERMGTIVDEIRDEEKDFPIRVVVDLDDACGACPHNEGTICLVSEGADKRIKSMDERVINHLKLEEGKLYRKSKLIDWTAQVVDPDDLDTLCKGCSWLSYGVCKTGIEKLRSVRSEGGETG